MEISGHLAGRRFFGGTLGTVWTAAEDRGVDLRSCGLEGTWGYEGMSFVWAQDGRLHRHAVGFFEWRSLNLPDVADRLLTDMRGDKVLWEDVGSAGEAHPIAASTRRWQAAILTALCSYENAWTEGYELLAVRLSRRFSTPALVLEYSWAATRCRWVVAVPPEPSEERLSHHAESEAAALLEMIPEGVGDEVIGPA
jgi:hypothetical protein